MQQHRDVRIDGPGVRHQYGQLPHRHLVHGDFASLEPAADEPGTELHTLRARAVEADQLLGKEPLIHVNGRT